MKLALILVVVWLGLSFLVHVVAWRLLHPTRYLVWLPMIFLIVPTIAYWIATDWLTSNGFVVPMGQLLAAILLYGVIATCYTGGYAGVVEYSPSAEILRVVSEAPTGIRIEDMQVSSLSEAALTGKRIRHMLKNGLITMNGESIRLTRFGDAVVAGCLLHRWLFNLQDNAAG